MALEIREISNAPYFLTKLPRKLDHFKLRDLRELGDAGCLKGVS